MRRDFCGLDYRLKYPLCEICGSKATETHHINKISKGGGDEYFNLMSICKCCHDVIDKRTKGCKI